MIRFFSSLRFMVMVSVSLIVVLLMGILLGRLGAWRMVMRSPFAEVSLNRVMLPEWITQRLADYPTVGIWLVVAGILGFLLLVNLLLSCGTTLWRRWKGARSWKSGLLLALHIVFGVTLVCHGLSLVWGQKTTAILTQGERMVLPDGRVVSVENLQFSSDPALLTRSRHDRTSSVYDWENNFVVLRVGEETLPPIRHLYPATDSAGLQYALPMFMDAARAMGAGQSHGHGPSGESRNAEGGGRLQGRDRSNPGDSPRPAALIVANRHQVDGLFLVSFALVLGLTAGFLVLTWNKHLR